MMPDSKEAPPGHKVLADWLGRAGTDEGCNLEMPVSPSGLSVGTKVRLNAEKALEDPDGRYARRPRIRRAERSAEPRMEAG